jgi:hypothetical protein
MSVVHCPHCGAKNFTIESWEDLDHCSSCGKPLGEQNGASADARGGHAGQSRAGRGAEGGDTRRPRPA